VKKSLTFIFAQVLALGSLAALAVMIINLISISGIRDHVDHRTSQILVVYSEIPVCFICAFIAQLVYRSSPVFMATVFVLLKICLRILCVPYIAGFTHFWLESGISLIAGLAGAISAYAMLSSKKDKPLHPVWAGITAFSVIIVSWAMTFITMKRF